MPRLAYFAGLVLIICFGCRKTELVQIYEPFETRDCFYTDKPATGEFGEAVSLELPIPPGVYAYVCGIDIQVETDGATGQSGIILLQTTNFNEWTYRFSMPAGSASFAQHFNWEFPVPAKASVPGSSITIFTPAVPRTKFWLKAAYGYPTRSRQVELPR